MRIIHYWLAVLAGLGVLSPSLAAAGQWTVQAGASYTEPDDDLGRDGFIGYRVALGYQWSPVFGAAAVIAGGAQDSERGEDFDALRYQVEGYYFPPIRMPVRLLPYAVAGLGYRREQSVRHTFDDHQFNVGVGVQGPMTHGFFWRADVRGYRSLDNEFTDITSLFAIGYRLPLEPSGP